MIRTSILLLSLAAAALAQAPLVNNVGNFIHNVADVERSLRFYKEVLGMDAPRPAGEWQTTEGVLKMYDAVGGKFRVANAQIPGSPMRVELAEFQGVEKAPVRRPWGVAGNSVLMLNVADLTSIVYRIKAANVPVLVDRKTACDGQGMVVADPDGFPVMLIAKGEAPGASNFTRMRFGFLASGDALAKGPFAALGLQAQNRTHICQPIEEALFGSPASIVTLSSGFEIWLGQGRPAGAMPVRPRDPGAAVLRFAVSDADAAVAALKGVQVNVVSAGGEIQTLAPGTARAAILRGPDGLLIQVVK